MFTGKGNGSRPAEDSVTAEKRQKGSRKEKVSGSRSENGCQSSTRSHVSCLQGGSTHLCFFCFLAIRKHPLVLFFVLVCNCHVLFNDTCLLPVLYRHRCQTPRLSSSILRVNTQSLLCPLSWQMCRHKLLWTTSICVLGKATDMLTDHSKYSMKLKCKLLTCFVRIVIASHCTCRLQTLQRNDASQFGQLIQLLKQTLDKMWRETLMMD